MDYVILETTFQTQRGDIHNIIKYKLHPSWEGDTMAGSGKQWCVKCVILRGQYVHFLPWLKAPPQNYIVHFQVVQISFLAVRKVTELPAF